MKAIQLILAALALAAPPARAQDFPPIYVYGENDDNTAKCAMSHDQAVAAVESALRYNHVSVASREAAVRSAALQAYVTMNPLDLGDVCAVSLSFSLEDHQVVRSSVLDADRRVTVVYCNRTSIMSGPKYDLQTRANDWFRDMTNYCLSEFQRG